MTKHHLHSHEHLLEEVIQDLKEKNIRITPQRKAILHYMIESQQHPTVEEIYHDLLPEQAGISLATIYNNLKVFVNEGLIKELKISGATSRYDFIAPAHHHVVCENCGRIADFDFPTLDQIERSASKQTGYVIYHSNLEVHGLCPECQKTLD